ncbi:hypothetical protein [Sphingobium vermicomposti]|uniref:hypothetical protein n=1 Tax=Sphingobium vermicomposti TaxID=529005 RepID=UPI001ABA692C|nr:hypothetical protein [Sphingobium vermicomposti]
MGEMSGARLIRLVALMEPIASVQVMHDDRGLAGLRLADEFAIKLGQKMPLESCLGCGVEENGRLAWREGWPAPVAVSDIEVDLVLRRQGSAHAPNGKLRLLRNTCLAYRQKILPRVGQPEIIEMAVADIGKRQRIAAGTKAVNK